MFFFNYYCFISCKILIPSLIHLYFVQSFLSVHQILFHKAFAYAASLNTIKEIDKLEKPSS